ncbi:MAG: alcohol dehydrogenase, partial [Chloroflexi bacterium]
MMAVTHTASPEPGLLPTTMRAVVLTGPNRHEVHNDVAVPRPSQMEVLCKVDSVAICGTDLYEGRFPGRWPKSYPFIPGHEWSGTVVEVGQGADDLGWRVGQRVAGTSHAGCGYCRMCRTGRYNLCENYGREPLHHQYGHYSQGADAEYVVQSIRSVFPIPDELELRHGAMVDTA